MHSAEYAITPPSQLAHGSSLLFSISPLEPLTITLVFLRLTFSPLLLNASFHFRKFSLKASYFHSLKLSQLHTKFHSTSLLPTLWLHHPNITPRRITYGKPFFLISHSITFLELDQMPFQYSENPYTTIFLIFIFLLHCLHNKKRVCRFSACRRTELHCISIQ